MSYKKCCSREGAEYHRGKLNLAYWQVYDAGCNVFM